MKKINLIIFISILFILSCEDKKDITPYIDTISPEVTITSPQDSSTVNEIVHGCTENEELRLILSYIFGDYIGCYWPPWYGMLPIRY